MREIEISVVKKGQKIVGKCKQYDSLAEAEKDLGKLKDGSSVALMLLNSAVEERERRRLRRIGPVSLAKLISRASDEVKLKILNFLEGQGISIS